SAMRHRAAAGPPRAPPAWQRPRSDHHPAPGAWQAGRAASLPARRKTFPPTAAPRRLPSCTDSDSDAAGCHPPPRCLRRETNDCAPGHRPTGNNSAQALAGRTTHGAPCRPGAARIRRPRWCGAARLAIATTRPARLSAWLRYRGGRPGSESRGTWRNEPRSTRWRPRLRTIHAKSTHREGRGVQMNTKHTHAGWNWAHLTLLAGMLAGLSAAHARGWALEQTALVASVLIIAWLSMAEWRWPHRREWVPTRADLRRDGFYFVLAAITQSATRWLVLAGAVML